MAMELIRIENAKAGQKLAQDVLDPQGVLLMKAGTVLTLEIIQRVKNRNVTQLMIEGGDGSGLSPEELEKKKREIDAELSTVFSDVIGNPVMAALSEAAKTYLRSRM